MLPTSLCHGDQSMRFSQNAGQGPTGGVLNRTVRARLARNMTVSVRAFGRAAGSRELRKLAWGCGGGGCRSKRSKHLTREGRWGKSRRVVGGRQLYAGQRLTCQRLSASAPHLRGEPNGFHHGPVPRTTCLRQKQKSSIEHWFLHVLDTARS